MNEPRVVESVTNECQSLGRAHESSSARAEQLISCLEGEIAKRDARIVELEHRCGVYGLELHNATERLQQAERQIKAIKAQEPVAFVHPEQLKGLPAESSATCAVWNKPGAMPSGTSLRVPLYAAPVAKPQVVMPDLELQAAADEAFRALEKAGDRIPDAREYMAARDGFREGAAWQARLNASPVQQVIVPVACSCGREYPANSYSAGFISGSGMCEECDAAMPAKDIPPQASAWVPAVLDEYERQTKTLPCQHEIPERGCSTYNWRMSVIRDLRAMIAAAPAAPAADAVLTASEWTKDADEWGGALNYAAWEFINECPEKSALLFNNTKGPLRAAIMKYAELVAASAKEPSHD